jgi:predicted flap endonuclease-1-like 5' DNA nuclease
VRTASGRVGRLVAFVLLVLSVRWLVLRRRSPTGPEPMQAGAGPGQRAGTLAAPLAEVPAVQDDGGPGEVPGDVLATDAGLTPEPAATDAGPTREPAATDAGLTPEPAAAEAGTTGQPAGATAETPAGGPDDLRAIRGIGPAIERTLHGLDITTYRQLAALDGPELERVRGALQDFRARVEREDWAGQARKLHRAKYGEDA